MQIRNFVAVRIMIRLRGPCRGLRSSKCPQILDILKYFTFVLHVRTICASYLLKLAMYRFRASEGPITVASTSRNTQPSVYIIPFFIYESVSWVFLQSILPYHRSSSDFIFRVGLPNLVSKTVLCFSKSSVVAKLDAKDSRSPVQGHD